MMQTVAMMRVLTEPMTQMMGPMLAALAGRPPPPMAAGGGMRDMIETMMLMDKFMGRRGGGGSTEPDWLKLTTAVTGVAKPLLEMAAAQRLEGTRTRKAIPAPAPVAASVPSPAAPGVVSPVPSGTAVPIRPAVPTGVDLSRPSPLPTGSLSQGVNIEAPSTQLPPAGDGESSMFAEYKKHVDALVDVARNGSSPVDVANAFFDQTMMQLPDEQYGQLASIVESDGFLTTIGLYNAHVKDLAPFFNAMRAQLIQRIVDADADDTSADERSA